MNERISQLAKLVMDGKLYHQTVPTEYDREDLFLPDAARNAKQFCEYMLNQEPQITEYSRLTGFFRFDGSCYGDIFTRIGYRHATEATEKFYCKPLHNLSSYESIHSAARFDLAVKYGINGYLSRIEKSKAAHTDSERLEYLDALKTVCGGIIAWADKCAARAREAAKKAGTQNRKKELSALSRVLPETVRNGADSFYGAVSGLYFFYAFLPDSIGLIDRYLYPYYRKDIDGGKITVDEAKEFLQELFLMIQAKKDPGTQYSWFTRGPECHFCIGGYTPDGKDGFNELSRLVVESLLDTPVYCPQISLRWTQKTPFETFKFMLDCERKDKNKRIAFVNDEPRIKGWTQAGISYEKAASYTLTGCYEAVLSGGTTFGSQRHNIVLAVTDTLLNRSEAAAACKTFDAFYSLFETEMKRLTEKMIGYSDKFHYARFKDIDVVSAVFMDGCIENAKSATQGGCDSSLESLGVTGITNVIDSLSVIKQFIYDEKIVSMAELIKALKADWRGYEDLRTKILNTGRFFGNNDPLPDGIANRFFDSFAACLDGKKDMFGFKVFGSRGTGIGYWPYHEWFGSLTEATPDGRRKGGNLTYGMSPSNGKDSQGLTALLSSVARADQTAVGLGNCSTNITVDGKMVSDDAQFEKTARMLETYFKMGGLYFNLNHVSKEDLIKAKANPADYKNLRVRVTGFSEHFVNLSKEMQDDIIARTVN